MSEQILDKKFNISYTKASFEYKDGKLTERKFGSVLMNGLMVNIEVPNELKLGEVFLYNFDENEEDVIRFFNMDDEIFNSKICDDESSKAKYKIVNKILDVMEKFDLSENENVDGYDLDSDEDNEGGEIV